MKQRIAWTVIAALVVIVVIAVVQRRVADTGGRGPEDPIQKAVNEAARPFRATDRQFRQTLWDELQPVVLANCEFERMGEAYDGGYLMCGNLLGEVEAGYSYGIANYDKWGCDISTKLGVKLHQYDCFDTRQPACQGGDTVFHAECVANVAKTEALRVFDTMENQFAKNGDANKRLVVKIDVEGAEWESLLAASDDTLQRIDQLAIELHFLDQSDFVQIVRRLKQFFYVAHLHFNNYACTDGIEPLPAIATEVLFVNKRIGVVDPARQWQGPHSLATPDDPTWRDCQTKAP